MVGDVAYVLGSRLPLHAGAAGTVQLAFLGDAERAAVVQQLKLVPLTERTITSHERLVEPPSPAPLTKEELAAMSAHRAREGNLLDVDLSAYEKWREEYYRAAGWSIDDGRPLPETLQRLGLSGFKVGK